MLTPIWYLELIFLHLTYTNTHTQRQPTDLHMDTIPRDTQKGAGTQHTTYKHTYTET